MCRIRARSVFCCSEGRERPVARVERGIGLLALIGILALTAASCATPVPDANRPLPVSAEDAAASLAFRSSLTDDERAWLQAHPVIRVAQDPSWAPIEFAEGDGTPSGMTADYLVLIEQRLGVTFERIRNLSWQDAYARMQRWDIDMTTTVAETTERTAFWAFTKPYMTMPIVIVTQAHVTYISDLRELAGRKVVVVDGYAASTWIARDYPEIQLVRVNTTEEAVATLQRGEVFACVENMLAVGYHLARLKLIDLKVSGTTPYANAQRMAVRKDWAPLAVILDKALDSVSQAERDAIYRKWLPVRFKYGFDSSRLLPVAGIVAMFLVGVAAWRRTRADEGPGLTSPGVRLTRWQAWLFAIASTVATFGLRFALDVPLYGQPTLVIFTLPIMLSAYFGGLGPGLLATALSFVGASYYLLPPIDSFAVASSAHRWQQFLVVLTGLSISGLSESLHRARRRADSATRDHQAAEARARAALDETRDVRAALDEHAIVAITDAKGTITFANDKFCTISGYAREELLGQNHRILNSGFHSREFFRDLWTTIARGDVWHGQIRNSAKDGSLYWVDTTIVPFPGPDGTPRHYVAIRADVTQRKQAEDANRRALQRLTEAQRIGQIGDWELDLASGAITWSPQTFEIFGRDPRLGPPQHYEENATLYEPASAALMTEKVTAAIASGEDQEYELVALRPDGRRVPVQARAVARKDDAGKVVGLYGTVQDLTARKREEQLIRESEDRLAFAMEAAQIGDWDMNLQTNVARRSLRHDQCFGYTTMLPDWGYDTFLAHVAAADRDRVDAGFRKAMAGEGEYDEQFRAPWSDGSVHWLWTKGRFYFDEAREPYRVAGIVLDVSERKRAEDAALRLAAIVESSEDAIVGKDLSGRVTSWNAGAEKLFGYAAAEVIGQPLLRIIPPDRHAEEAIFLAQITRGETVRNFETVRLRRDGSNIDIAITVSAIKDAAGHIVGASTMARDVTSRKHAEQAVHDSEERLRVAVEAAGLGTWDLDLTTDVAVRSLRHDEIWGYGELQPEWGLEISLRHMPLEDHSIVRAAHARAAGTGLLTFEARVIWPDGSIHWIASHGRVGYDSDGRPVRIIGVVADITEQHESARVMRESEARYRSLFENSPDAIIVVDSQGTILDANSTTCRMLGFSHAELLTMRSTDFVAPEDAPDVAQLIADVAVGADDQREWRLIRKDRSVVTVDARSTLMPDGRLMGIMRDATERLKALKTLDDLRLAEAADRVKSAFLATMSHELRTPLNAILGFTGIILQGLAGPITPEQSKQLGMVRGSGRHLLELINDVLDLSKIEAGQLQVRAEAFDLRLMLERATATLKPQADAKGLSLDLVMSQDVGLIVSDRRRVEQIVINLLSNAIKFTARGRIGVAATVEGSGRSSGAGPTVHIAVSDTGIGIAPRDLETLFQPFHQLEAGLTLESGGTGLGLAISRRLATLLGAGISVESEWARGSTFTLTLPLKDAHP